MSEVLTAIGLMSGTSLDGIDAAIIETDGEGVAGLGPALSVTYPEKTRAILRQAIEAALKLKADDKHPQVFGEAQSVLTKAHADLVASLLAANGLRPEDIDVIGFHGQTVIHRPEEHWTVQLGGGAELAVLTGIDVVNDFRSADVAAGGEGAPFAPVYHGALAQGLGELPVAVLNIGGVANLTWVGADGGLVAFDTGPGNGLMDDWMERHTGVHMDADGQCAAQGQVDEACLERLMASDYFGRPPPKSLDRHDFNLDAVSALSLEDGAATLAAFTAATILKGAAHFPEPVCRYVVCGGGRHNPVLMANLAKKAGVPVVPAESVNWRGDSLEAEAFAYMAVRSLRGLPISFPTTTGVPRPMVGGVLHRAPRRD